MRFSSKEEEGPKNDSLSKQQMIEVVLVTYKKKWNETETFQRLSKTSAKDGFWSD